MTRRKKHARIPGMTRRRGGWRHIESLLYEKHGIVFEEGERVVTALPVAGDTWDSRKKGENDAR